MPTRLPEDYQPIVLAAPPRPILIRNQNHFLSTSSYPRISNGSISSNLTTNEEGSFSQPVPVIIDKEIPHFLSNNIPPPPSSNVDVVRPPPPPILSGTNSNFSSSFNPPPLPPTEHIYENVPTLMQTVSHSRPYYNPSAVTNEDPSPSSNGFLYYPIDNSPPIPQTNGNGYLLSDQKLSNSLPAKETNPLETIDTIPPTQKPQIISAGRHRNQPVYFANHLTNPLFNVDRQLLINTIANQFGVELHSPQLQNLISNQHLFVARKRTFANMVWQMTPDEETALCSSPISSGKDTIDIDQIETNLMINTRPILKVNKSFPSISKRRNITWDNTLE